MPTAVEWADVLLEFLEALVHQILYRFDVYPAASFEKRGAYALCVHRCRHPAVCDYVHAVLQDVKVCTLETSFSVLCSYKRIGIDCDMIQSSDIEFFY
jgi:hypothetical protein